MDLTAVYRLNGLRGEMNGLNAKIDGLESTLQSELQPGEGVLGAKLDGLAVRVKGLEDEVRSSLVDRYDLGTYSTFGNPPYYFLA